MKILLKSKHFIIVDEFLGDENREEIWKFIQAIAFSRTNILNWSGAWRLDDGAAMRGATYAYGELAQSIAYPANQPIDSLFEAIFKFTKDNSDAVGAKDKDWKAMSAIPTIYPRGSGLYWHRDAEAWAGSFTYYCHPEWNIHWGGELLVSDEDTAASIPAEYGVFMQAPRTIQGIKNPASFGAHFDTKCASDLLMENAGGSYFFPKPDRMIILRGHVPHCVNKVQDAAGDRIRASISGFFLKNKAV